MYNNIYGNWDMNRSEMAICKILQTLHFALDAKNDENELMEHRYLKTALGQMEIHSIYTGQCLEYRTAAYSKPDQIALEIVEVDPTNRNRKRPIAKTGVGLL